MNIKLIALALISSQLISAGPSSYEKISIKKSIALAIMMQGANGSPLMAPHPIDAHLLTSGGLHWKTPSWAPFHHVLPKSAASQGIWHNGKQLANEISDFSGNEISKISNPASSAVPHEIHENGKVASHPTDIVLSKETEKLMVEMDHFQDREWAIVADYLGVPEDKLNRDLVKSDVERFEKSCSRKLAKRGFGDTATAIVKGPLQAMAGDLDGAWETMDNFSKDCPIISQVHEQTCFKLL